MNRECRQTDRPSACLQPAGPRCCRCRSGRLVDCRASASTRSADRHPRSETNLRGRRFRRRRTLALDHPSRRARLECLRSERGGSEAVVCRPSAVSFELVSSTSSCAPSVPRILSDQLQLGQLVSAQLVLLVEQKVLRVELEERRTTAVPRTGLLHVLDRIVRVVIVFDRIVDLVLVALVPLRFFVVVRHALEEVRLQLFAGNVDMKSVDHSSSSSPRRLRLLLLLLPSPSTVTSFFSRARPRFTRCVASTAT